MIIKMKDLPRRTMGIYKINYPNGKIYIGQSVDIKRRMYEHWDANKATAPCDVAIFKYKVHLDEIEILEFIDDENELNEREKYWIEFYDSNNKDKGYNLTPGGDTSCLSGEDNNTSVFTNAQVLDIRKRRYEGERKKDVYKDYSNIPFSTFEHVWLGRGYPQIGKEYLIPVGEKTRQEYSSEANKGLKNGRAKCTREEILEIRRLRDEEKMMYKDIQALFPHISMSTVRRIALRESYADVE